MTIADLKLSVADVIKTNGLQGITGANLQEKLFLIIDELADKFTYFVDVLFVVASRDLEEGDINKILVLGSGVEVTIPLDTSWMKSGDKFCFLNDDGTASFHKNYNDGQPVYPLGGEFVFCVVVDFMGINVIPLSTAIIADSSDSNKQKTANRYFFDHLGGSVAGGLNGGLLPVNASRNFQASDKGKILSLGAGVEMTVPGGEFLQDGDVIGIMTSETDASFHTSNIGDKILPAVASGQSELVVLSAINNAGQTAFAMEASLALPSGVDEQKTGFRFLFDLLDGIFVTDVENVIASRDFTSNDAGKVLILAAGVQLTLPLGVIFPRHSVMAIISVDQTAGFTLTPGTIFHAYSGGDRFYAETVIVVADESAGQTILTPIATAMITDPVDGLNKTAIRYLMDNLRPAEDVIVINANTQLDDTYANKILLCNSGVEITLPAGGLTVPQGTRLRIWAYDDTVTFHKEDMTPPIYMLSKEIVELTQMIGRGNAGSNALWQTGGAELFDIADSKYKTINRFLYDNNGIKGSGVVAVNASRDFASTDKSKLLLIDAGVAMTMPAGQVWGDGDVFTVQALGAGVSIQLAYSGNIIYPAVGEIVIFENGNPGGNSTIFPLSTAIIVDSGDGNKKKTAFNYLLDDNGHRPIFAATNDPNGTFGTNFENGAYYFRTSDGTSNGIVLTVYIFSKLLSSWQAIKLRGYITWQFRVIQLGGSDPSMTEYVNETNATTLTLTRTALGVYEFTADANVFTPGQTHVMTALPHNDGASYNITTLSASTIKVSTFLAGVPADSQIVNTLFEIRIYG